MNVQRLYIHTIQHAPTTTKDVVIGARKMAVVLWEDLLLLSAHASPSFDIQGTHVGVTMSSG
jgi:hypothetical protein